MVRAVMEKRYEYLLANGKAISHVEAASDGSTVDSERKAADLGDEPSTQAQLGKVSILTLEDLGIHTEANKTRQAYGGSDRLAAAPGE